LNFRRECSVCLEEKVPLEFVKFANAACKHKPPTICSDCIYEHIVVQNNNEPKAAVRCPENGCSNALANEFVYFIMFSKGNRGLAERFNQMHIDDIMNNNEFIWCAHNCGSGQFHDSDGTNQNNNIVKCYNCKKKTCFHHKSKWHSSLTCEQYDQMQREDNSSTEWIRQNAKTCPKCSVFIEKNDGCDQMLCKCGYKFCWLCLADQKLISAKGNHFHKPDCKHYRSIDGR
jgi:hypothetical protein